MNAHYDEVEIQGRVYHQIYYVNRNSLFPYGDLLLDDAKVTTTAWYNPFPTLSEADIIPNFNDIRGYLYDHKMITSLKDMKVKNGLIEVTTKETKIDNVIKVLKIYSSILTSQSFNLTDLLTQSFNELGMDTRLLQGQKAMVELQQLCCNSQSVGKLLKQTIKKAQRPKSTVPKYSTSFRFFKKNKFKGIKKPASVMLLKEVNGDLVLTYSTSEAGSTKFSPKKLVSELTSILQSRR